MAKTPCGLSMKGTNAENKCKEKRDQRRLEEKLHACDGCPSSPKEKRTASHNVRPWQPVMAKGSGNKIPVTMERTF